MKGVAVTGLGVVTSIAGNVKDFFQSIENHIEPSFTKNHRFNLDIPLAQVKAEYFTQPEKDTFDHPTGRLCLTAAKECLSDLGDLLSKRKPDALIVGTASGGLNLSEDYVFSLLSNEKPKDFNFSAQGMLSATTRLLAEALRIRGRVMTISTACSSSSNAIALGAMLVAEGRCERVLVGGGDALSSTAVHSFHAMGLTDPLSSRPFAEDRQGLTLGEGVGFLLLEPLDLVLMENRFYYAEILGYAMGSEAYSIATVKESGEGIKSVMRKALRSAHLSPEDIDFINAHGIGTKEHDRSEAQAIHGLFPYVPVASIKGLVGHCFGGSGAINAIASIYSILNQKAWTNFSNGLNALDCPVNLVQKGGTPLKKRPFVMSNSFSIAGNSCSIIFGTPDRKPKGLYGVQQ